MIAQLDNIMVGDRVRWQSPVGAMRGEVKEISLKLNAKNELVPWLIIQTGSFSGLSHLNQVTVCGNDLKMMKFEVIFSDRVVE